MLESHCIYYYCILIALVKIVMFIIETLAFIKRKHRRYLLYTILANFYTINYVISSLCVKCELIRIGSVTLMCSFCIFATLSKLLFIGILQAIIFFRQEVDETIFRRRMNQVKPVCDALSTVNCCASILINYHQINELIVSELTLLDYVKIYNKVNFMRILQMQTIKISLTANRSNIFIIIYWL